MNTFGKVTSLAIGGATSLGAAAVLINYDYDRNPSRHVKRLMVGTTLYVAGISLYVIGSCMKRHVSLIRQTNHVGKLLMYGASGSLIYGSALGVSLVSLKKAHELMISDVSIDTENNAAEMTVTTETQVTKIRKE